VVREDHLDLCIEKAQELHDKKKESIIKNIQQREKQKRSWEKIQVAVGKNTGYGVSRLGVPLGMEDASTEDIWNYLSDHTSKPKWVFITDPVKIEKRLWEWQFFHYNLAGETPLASEAWRDKLDPVSRTDKEIEDILKDSLNLQSHLPTEAAMFFNHLTTHTKPVMSESSVEINTTVFQAFYKKSQRKYIIVSFETASRPLESSSIRLRYQYSPILYYSDSSLS